MLACFNRPGKARNYNNPVREGSGLSLAFQRQEFSDVPYFQMLHAQGESEAGCFNSFSEGGGGAMWKPYIGTGFMRGDSFGI